MFSFLMSVIMIMFRFPALASLICVSVHILSSPVRLKHCVITARIEKYETVAKVANMKAQLWSIYWPGYQKI